ncbi:MAG: hypothetical protein J6V54_02920 [Bacteroidales bacterium]|nr:hypothetical protein [Bacteroidales bacterium]
MFRELWDAFCEWASEAWNWLKNFFTRVWEKIRSWYSALRGDILKWLKEAKDEVVVLGGGSKLGKEILDKIKQECPDTTSIGQYENEMTLLHFYGEDLQEVSTYEAKTVDQTDDFDRDLQKKDGILRLKL